MNSHGHGKYAFVLAANARIEGMKEANRASLDRGEKPIYEAACFFAEARVMEDLGREIMEMGWQA